MCFILLTMDLRELYQERIAALDKAAALDFLQYARNEVPLFASADNTIKNVTMAVVEKEIAEACAAGLGFVEYKVHKHLYPGYKGDNISFLTGKYYIYDYAQTEYIEIPGAPSYIDLVRAKLPGLIVTFREGTHNNGYLRVELP
jgi:hypothetical protein